MHIFSFLKSEDLQVRNVCKSFSWIGLEAINLSNNGNDWFISLCEEGFSNSVEGLLKNKTINPSANKNCAIWLACGQGHLEVVKILLKDPRVDPSANQNHAFTDAYKKRRLEVVKE